MSDEIAISVSDVSKAYRIWRSPAARLMSPIKEAIANVFPDGSAPSKYLKNAAHGHYRDFYALRNISLQISRGESFGIMGRNGSGKSTLLQIIAGTLQPTSGSVTTNGRIAALLELGSGFNPEFTGIENVELNASILGLSRDEIARKMDSILEFADIGSFIAEPVKTYSSGMVIRLAFSVATHVDADLLLIDEALAVGDVFFQQRCYRRLEMLKENGAAIILVSHGPNDVEQFCSRALLLKDGEAVGIGPASEIVKQYYLINRQELNGGQPEAPAAEAVEGGDGSLLPPEDAFLDISQVRQIGDGTARCLRVALTDTDGRACRRFEQGQVACVYYEYELIRDIETPVVGIVIFNRKNIIVHGKNSIEYGSPMPDRVAAGQVLRCRQEVQLDLQVDQYTLEIGIASISNLDLGSAAHMSHPDLSSRIVRHCHLTGLGPFEVVFRRHGLPVQLLHHGIANLRGSVEVLP